jgi:hypothetical protein
VFENQPVGSNVIRGTSNVDIENDKTDAENSC